MFTIIDHLQPSSFCFSSPGVGVHGSASLPALHHLQNKVRNDENRASAHRITYYYLKVCNKSE